MVKSYFRVIIVIGVIAAAVALPGCGSETSEESMEAYEEASTKDAAIKLSSEASAIEASSEASSNISSETSPDSIKIALIDTGIVGEAVNSEHILPGWNYCTDSDDTEDKIGHGTGIASLILGSDRAGIVGGAVDSYIVPLVCQTEDEEGNELKANPEELAEIFRDAVTEYDCDIISFSGGIKEDNEELRQAIMEVCDMGALVICSAGNEGTSDIYYPGGYEEVLCVGSADEEMKGRAEFSQYNEMVDLYAPGENQVVATMKGNQMKVSGTSYSAAYITAVAASLWQDNPQKTSQQIIEQIMEHTVLVGEDRLLSLE